MTQTWNDLLFAHWQVTPDLLRPHVPEHLELDLFDGQAWLAVVPFVMTNVGVRGIPAIPGTSTFAEINVRTYVRVGDRAGVFFFSLDAESRLAVWGARVTLNLPYYLASMKVERADSIVYRSDRRAASALRTFAARYAPIGPTFEPSAGTIEHFLTERYCLYGISRRGKPFPLDIHHRPWTLATAEAEIEAVSIADGFGAMLTRPPDLLHFAQRQDVVAWYPGRTTPLT